MNIKTIMLASLIYIIPACATPSPLMSPNSSMEQYLNKHEEEQVQNMAPGFTSFGLTRSHDARRLRFSNSTLDRIILACEGINFCWKRIKRLTYETDVGPVHFRARYDLLKDESELRLTFLLY